MSNRYSILETVPLVVFRADGISHLVRTPDTLYSAKRAAIKAFPSQFDFRFLRFEIDLPGTVTAVVDDSGWLFTVRLAQEQTGSPPVFLVKDSPIEQASPSRSTTSGNGHDTGDLFSSNGGSMATTPASEVGQGAGEHEVLRLSVETLTGKTLEVPAFASDDVYLVKCRIEAVEGVPVPQQRLIWRSKAVDNSRTSSELRIVDKSQLYMVLPLRGGKPVIYLFPPTPLPDVQVSLTLSPQWHFSAVYPVRDIIKSKDGSSTVVWTVDVGPEGQLVDKKSEVDLSYLFWEAVAERSTTASSTSPVASNGVSGFDPSNPSLTPSNGAVLPLALFLPYLDKVLFDLSLHTSARTEFITFWLPHFNRIASRAQHIAFRFLPQREYEQAARIEVDPRPDVVTRVFLLFKGVDASEAGLWRKAESVDWVKEVGVDPDEVANEALFRVLEWGGMEVVG
ncbi:hypothetical protein JCM6882_002969 [Rhodosporidiobolus microsporus]